MTTQQKRRMEFEIVSPCPLAEVALLLEERFGCMVTYEDVPYCHPDDMIRDEVGRIIPRGGRILVQYQLDDSLREIINRVLEVHIRSGYPGVFALEECAGGYHIVPRSFRNAYGVMEERLPLLNTKISLPSETRSGVQLVEDIMLALSVARRESIGMGMLPINAFIQHVSMGKVLKGKAIDLLVDLFREMKLRLSWQFLNLPGKAEFLFNVHQLPERATQK